MDLSMADLVEQSGAPARTIRHWISLGLLPRPEGTGPAAVYSREHLLRLWVITAQRAAGTSIEPIRELLGRLTARQMAAYKPKAHVLQQLHGRDTATADGAGAEGAIPGALPGALPEAQARTAPRLRARSDEAAIARDAALPGRRYALVPLLPGMVLMVDEDAAGIVRRAALEIVERYGADRG